MLSSDSHLKAIKKFYKRYSCEVKKLVTATLFVAFILGITIFLLIDDEENQTQSTPITDERVPVISDSEVSEEKNSLNIELIRVLQLDLSKLAEETFTMNIEEIRASHLERVEVFKERVVLAQEVNTLLGSYPWGPSTEVEELQSLLGLVVDGVYGEDTRTAHISELTIRKLIIDNVPNGTESVKVATSVNRLPIPEIVSIPARDCLEETPHLRSCWPGHEGGNEPTIQAAFDALPLALRNRIPSDFILVNGCHPFSDRCPYGVMDSRGWGPNGRCCDMPWGRSIWISNRGINSGHLNDIMIHEAFHAVEYTTLNQDIRTRLTGEFGDSERAADGAVAYFGGNWQHYRGSGTGLTDSQSALFDEIFS